MCRQGDEGWCCAGYCSLVHFSEGELGVPLPDDKTPAHLQPLMEAASKTAVSATSEQSAPAKAAGGSLPHSMRSTPAGKQQPGQAEGSAQPLRTVLKQIEPATQGGMLGRPAMAAQQAQEQLPAQPAAAQEERCQELMPLQKASLAEEGSLKRPLTDSAKPVSAPPSSDAKKQKRIMPTAMAAAPLASPVPAVPASGDCANQQFSCMSRLSLIHQQPITMLLHDPAAANCSQGPIHAERGF